MEELFSGKLSLIEIERKLSFYLINRGSIVADVQRTANGYYATFHIKEVCDEKVDINFNLVDRDGLHHKLSSE